MNKHVDSFLFLGSKQEHYQKFCKVLGVTGQFHDCSQSAGDFSRTLSIADISTPDFIIIDLTECQEIKTNLLSSFIKSCKYPVFALTASNNQHINRPLMEKGVDDYLNIDDLHPEIIYRALRYTAEKQSIYQQLEEQSLFDSLTGIPNRQLFKQNLRFLVSQARNHQTGMTLMILNIDNFAQINHEYGHDFGDAVLQETAARLQKRLRQHDTIARIAGDEFAITLHACDTPHEVNIISKNILDLVTAQINIDATTVQFNMSIGISILDNFDTSTDDLLTQCKQALNKAQASENQAIVLYDSQSNQLNIKQQELYREIRRALKMSEFRLFYQPKINIDTNAVESVECLLRWPHPEKGMISPVEFIPAAEESGLIVPLGYWIIRQACEDMQSYVEAGNEPIDFAVNLSFRQLQDGMFVRTVKRIIEQSGIDPTRLEFELTETAILSNYQQTYTSMMALSELGITFSLDDFGTGFSSFTHLQQLPISALKIDRSFVSKLNEHEDNAIIVKAMIGLAHSLRLSVIAEGVENEQQLIFLKNELCDFVQGFYYSPAISIEKLTVFIDEHLRIA